MLFGGILEDGLESRKKQAEVGTSSFDEQYLAQTLFLTDFRQKLLKGTKPDRGGAQI